MYQICFQIKINSDTCLEKNITYNHNEGNNEGAKCEMNKRFIELMNE